MGKLAELTARYHAFANEACDKADARNAAWDAISGEVYERLRSELEPATHQSGGSLKVAWDEPPGAIVAVGMRTRHVKRGMASERGAADLVEVKGPVLQMGAVLTGHVAAIYTPVEVLSRDFVRRPDTIWDLLDPAELRAPDALEELMERFFEQARKEHWTSPEAFREIYHLQLDLHRPIGFSSAPKAE